MAVAVFVCLCQSHTGPEALGQFVMRFQQCISLVTASRMVLALGQQPGHRRLFLDHPTRHGRRQATPGVGA